MKDRNASASLFGWQFQANAAIVLFIKNILNAARIRIEGDEDIEITLDDGMKIYGQAKASVSPNPGNGATTRFHNALNSLADDLKKTDCKNIIYVTNDEYPFGNNLRTAVFGNDSYLNFTELSDPIRNFVIQAALKKNINQLDLEKFSVCVIGFYGEDSDTKHKIIHKYVDDLINRLNLHTRGTIKAARLRDIWGTLFEENASKFDKEKTISKSQFIWPIIVSLCHVSEDDSFFEDTEDDLIQDIISQYNRIIDLYTERFSFTTRVMSDYSDFEIVSTSKKARERRREFIDANWSNYSEELDLTELDDETAEILMKLILKKILVRTNIIQEIKREVNL